MTSRTLPLVLAVPLVLAAGVAEGVWEHRWVASQVLEHAVARLDDVPLSVGEWEGHEQQLDPRQVTHAEISGYRWLLYVNKWTKATVGVLIVCGRPGPVVLHTPDICFPGGDYPMIAPAESRAVEVPGLARPVQVETARFRRPGFVGSAEWDVFWSWSASGDWVTAEHPRVAFARAPALYRIYVILPVDGAGRWEGEGRPFVDVFLPELTRRLFPAAMPD
jgi:hypothetical protein